jgi:serine/threonine protein kinase/WD40 repeat protein
MPTSSDDRNPIEMLAEEFAERLRRGEHPSLTEYVEQYPQHADEIRELFPALVAMEQLKPMPAEPTGAFDGQPAPHEGAAPERLGDYRILREVGRGGMGVVYEAEQVSLGRHVALKVLPSHALLNPTYLERFRREARAAAKLHHTNIVPVFGVGEEHTVHFYAMQFIRGEGLDRVLFDLRRLRRAPGGAAGGQPPTGDVPSEGSVAQSLLNGLFAEPRAARAEHPGGPADTVPISHVEPKASTTLSAAGSDAAYYRSVARVGLQVADALAYAHRQGVLHRDVKPSNLLLDAQGTVWVTDFGLAKADGTDELTHTGDIVGTIRFMAPERFDGRSLPQSDVYSLGLTLYELLTLRPAFDDSNKGRLIEKVLHEPAVSPRRLDPRVPRDLETVVLKCLAKEPADRYATAEELADDLRRYLADRPIKARRASHAERVWRWARRNPAVASLLAAVAALLAAVAVVSAFYAAHQKAAATELAGALRDSEAKRWESLRDKARAMHMSRHPGQRVESLKAIQEALKLPLPPGHTLDELRTEAIAALALPDVEVLQEWEGLPAGTVGLDFDGNLERYARLATDGTVSLRRVSDDAEVVSWQEQTEGAWPGGNSNLRFSPDGRFLCIRHTLSGRLTVRRLDGPKQIIWYNGTKAKGSWAIDFSTNGKRLAYIQTDTSIAVVDLTSRQVHCLPPTGAEDQNHIQLAPDGDRFALSVLRAGMWAVEVRDAATGQVQRSFPHPTSATAWHPNGQTLATCSEPDHRILLWDLASGRQLRVLEGHKVLGIRCAFTHTGDRLLSNDWNGVLRVWEPSSGRQLLTFPSLGYNTMRISPDDRVSHNGADPTRLQLLRLHAGLEYRTIAPSGSHIRGIDSHPYSTVPPGGRLLAATATDGAVLLIDLAAGREVAALSFPAGLGWPLLWKPSGDLLTCGPTGLLHWPVRADPADPARYRLGPPEQLLPYKSRDQWGSSADGQTIAIPDYNGGAIVVHRGLPVRTVRLPPQQDVRSCAVSPDGHWVATGSHHCDSASGAKVWDATTGEPASEFRVPGMCTVTFSPDGRWLLTNGGGCRLWEVGYWTEGPKVGGSFGCFSPDGGVLAVEDSPGAIRLVRPESGRELARLEAPEQTPLMPRCFTPDGTRLIAVGTDTQALHVWDLRRIRAELVKLGLDWDAPPYSDPGPEDRTPLEVTVTGAEAPAGPKEGAKRKE